MILFLLLHIHVHLFYCRVILLSKFLFLCFSPYFSSAIGYESSTCIGKVCIVCAPCTSSCSYSYSYYTSFSLLRNSFSSLSFCYNSYIFLSISSNICLSLLFYTPLLSCYHLFASISKTTLSTSGSYLNLSPFSAFFILTIFLLHLSCTCLRLVATYVVAPCGDVALSAASHSTTMLSGSLNLEEL